MSWIPHLMVLDDDPRVLDSLLPSFATDLGLAVAKTSSVANALNRGEPGSRNPGQRGPFQIKVSAHGFTSDRLSAYRHRSPHQIHLHLVRERGGRFDLARKLLSQQLFAVVVSDLRFSDDAGGQRAGQLFVDEVQRVHPAVQGLLYSAYPRPDGFPIDRFVRKSEAPNGGPGLAEIVSRAIEKYLAEPAVSAFTAALGDLGVVYQSESFGTTLAELFDLARLLGAEGTGSRPLPKSRRPLPTLLLDGESGTGKRALAGLFHAATDRRKAPMAIASCNELTNETLLRSILFGHKRGAFTDARDDRAGLVAAAGRGVLLLDDFHRLPAACSAILHSFLEDGEFSRLGEEEVRRQAEALAVLTVETAPWQDRRRSGELPLAFLARVERLPLTIAPLRERPEDIEAQALWLTRVVADELGTDLELAPDAVEGLKSLPFVESNSRELRNLIERVAYRHSRETETLSWDHFRAFLSPSEGRSAVVAPPAGRPLAPGTAPLNDWQRRLRALASKILIKGTGLAPEKAEEVAATLFDAMMPPLWTPTEEARNPSGLDQPIPWPVWEDLWRCFSVARLGGPAPAERVLGIPANTLRQWINDREAR